MLVDNLKQIHLNCAASHVVNNKILTKIIASVRSDMSIGIKLVEKIGRDNGEVKQNIHFVNQ